MRGQAGVEVSFTDTAGLHWRRVSGDLEELPEGAIDHYHHPEKML